VDGVIVTSILVTAGVVPAGPSRQSTQHANGAPEGAAADDAKRSTKTLDGGDSSTAVGGYAARRNQALSRDQLGTKLATGVERRA
jgi:hypothetical protein